MSNFAGLAEEIAEIIGDDLTAKLLRKLGGTEISIAANPAGTILADTIGVSAAEKLSEELGSGRIQLPCGQYRGREKDRLDKKTKAVAQLNQGLSERAVALSCGLHLRTVKRYSAELAGIDDARQTSMMF